MHHIVHVKGKPSGLGLHVLPGGASVEGLRQIYLRFAAERVGLCR